MKSLQLVIFFLTILLIIAQSPDKLYDELFDAVQSQRIFPDSKTFCDAIPRDLTASGVVALYRSTYNELGFNLRSFVLNNFILPNTTIIVHDKWTIEEHCHHLWPLLTRTTKNENFSSFINVPDQFVVPGGRFREFYYWDTYFTMLGLLRSNEIELINNMLKNFAYLIQINGFIPNGNRYYYEGRSQPPFFSLMTELVKKSDEYKDALQKEYDFWMNKRNITLEDGTILNRYYDDENIRPRPEAYFEDKEIASKRNNTDIYVELRAAAESGWDFSSRWMEDEKDLSTTITTNLLPVDLNCLLYHLEVTLGKQKEAESRRTAIQKYMWSDGLKFFTDYNYVKKSQTSRLTLAGLFPLWLNVSTDDQAQNVARQVESLFLRDGGVVTTLSNQSTQQWDSPNGWAPLQFVTYRALLKTPGYETLARTIRKRWMNLNERVFKDSGKMMEKYDVVDINKPAGGGEYETQDGFGWTNGVYLEMLHDEQPEPEPTPKPGSNAIKYHSTFFQIICSISLSFFIFQ
jgi:alpha,alpha-trehalase